MIGDMSPHITMSGRSISVKTDREGCPQTLSETGSLTQRDIEG